MNCHFCTRPDFTNGWVRPPLCEQHLELALIRGRLQRSGLHFNLRNAQREYQLAATGGYSWSFTIDRLPELINQMSPEEYLPAPLELETA